MSEAKFQSRLILKYEKKGYYVIKLIQTNKNGIPDLLLLKDKVIPLFIEVKGKKGVVSELQKYRMKELTKAKFKTVIMYEDGRVQTGE